jgi:hypothetical protein
LLYLEVLVVSSYVFSHKTCCMLKLKLFISSMLGVMSMIFSYYIETTLESNFKIDRHIASQISVLVEN